MEDRAPRLSLIITLCLMLGERVQIQLHLLSYVNNVIIIVYIFTNISNIPRL